MSVEIILGQIAESLRDLARESRADSIAVDTSGLETVLDELVSSVDTVAEKLESLDTHLVEIINAVPELAKLIGSGMPQLIQALRS
jgi:hypothetical protein